MRVVQTKKALANRARWKKFSMQSIKRDAGKLGHFGGMTDEERNAKIEEHMDKKGYQRGPTLWANGARRL